MKFLLAALFLFLVSCATDPEGLKVSTYHLRESMFQENEDPMVRGEVQRYLHGAVTVEERRQKIGQYYHVTWVDSSSSNGSVEVVFEYLQAGSGSRIKRLVQRMECSQKLDAYFTIAGADYAKNGRVLAWRASVRIAGKELASKKSYLWR